MDFEQYRVLWARLDAISGELWDKSEPNLRYVSDLMVSIRQQLEHDYPEHFRQLNCWHPTASTRIAVQHDKQKWRNFDE